MNQINKTLIPIYNIHSSESITENNDKLPPSSCRSGEIRTPRLSSPAKHSALQLACLKFIADPHKKGRNSPGDSGLVTILPDRSKWNFGRPFVRTARLPDHAMLYTQNELSGVQVFVYLYNNLSCIGVHE